MITFLRQLVVLVVLTIDSVRMQNSSSSHCTLYKRQLFESVYTFSYFFSGAEEKNIQVDNCKPYSPFVVGGVNALPKEFPAAARLGHFQAGSEINWFCGGTLISERYVLTAAHCFYATEGVVNRVRLGELDFSTDTDDADPQDFEVQQLIEHPDYSYGAAYNDIGLVKLDSVVNLNLYKLPACLPTRDNVENQDFLIAIGWGHKAFAGSSAQHLQKVKLEPYSYGNCVWLAEGPDGRERLPQGLQFDSQICAGSKLAKDTCYGDSGGPLLIYHQDYPCMYYVVGITSAGTGGCGIPNVPAIYTRVYYYLNWIEKHVWNG